MKKFKEISREIFKRNLHFPKNLSKISEMFRFIFRNNFQNFRNYLILEIFPKIHEIPVFSKLVPKFHKFYLKFCRTVKFTQNFLKIFFTFCRLVFLQILRKFSRKFTQNFNKLS